MHHYIVLEGTLVDRDNLEIAWCVNVPIDVQGFLDNTHVKIRHAVNRVGVCQIVTVIAVFSTALFVALTSIIYSLVIIFVFHLAVAGAIIFVLVLVVAAYVVIFVSAAIVAIVVSIGLISRVIGGEFINAFIFFTMGDDRQ